MMIKKWSYTAHTFTLYSLCQEKLWGFWKVKEEATLSKLSEREKLWYVNVNDVNCFQTCHLVIYEERCLTRASRLMLRSVLGGFLKGISTNCQAKFCPLSRKWVKELLCRVIISDPEWLMPPIQLDFGADCNWTQTLKLRNTKTSHNQQNCSLSNININKFT